MSEMAFARFLIRDHPQERARLRRADNERLYGLQFATNNIGEGVRAAELAAASGAAWVDLNCGCPIYGALQAGHMPGLVHTEYLSCNQHRAFSTLRDASFT